jgi:deoxycytidylate deaminase
MTSFQPTPTRQAISDVTYSCSRPRRVGAVENSELVIGLVTPIGTNTTGLAEEVKRVLSDCDYTVIVIRLSDLLLPVGTGTPAPLGEFEDRRIRRLIAAGNEFCKLNDDPAALARLAVKQIRQTRLQLLRQDDEERPATELVGTARRRTAYVLHSLKRADEVELLREIYAGQFVLIGSQSTHEQRIDNLLRRNLSPTTDSAKREVVKELIQLDGNDNERLGQNVSDTYPRADFFLNNNDDVHRVVGLLFGEPIPPTIGEYAMYVARASAARSLAFSRKVGAAIVVGDAVVSTGYNDVPPGQVSDVLQSADTSEQFKQANLRDTLSRLKAAGMLRQDLPVSDEAVTQAALALKGGELMGVIEYQRAVHAEAWAIDDATVRGVSPKDGTLYVTTYPCHLCYKHALSVRIKEVRYIDPYPKSRAAKMFPEGSADRLVPFAGVAPRRYMETFDDRPAFLSDPSGIFQAQDRRVAHPLLAHVRNDADRAERERSAVNGLRKEYR